MTKMTYSKALTAILNGEPMTEEVRERLEALKASLDRKSSSDKKPTAQQVANDGIKHAILAHLSNDPDRMMTITEIMKEVPACAELTNQRVSAIVRQMVNDGAVKREEDKRKAYFRIAG